MSKQIDLTKPLSDFDRAYLEARDRNADLRTNFEAVGGAEPAQPNKPKSGPEATEGALGHTGLTAEQERQSREAAEAALGGEPSDEDFVEYNDMTVPQLKAELDARAKEASTEEEKTNLAYKANDPKPALVAKLEKDDELVAARED